jgi:hypothetical protein
VKECVLVIETQDREHTPGMVERQNTIVCIFDTKSPRISAVNIHEWIFETLRLAEGDLQVIQIDGPRRHVYIKFKHAEQIQTVLRETAGQCDYRHANGELSKVKI